MSLDTPNFPPDRNSDAPLPGAHDLQRDMGGIEGMPTGAPIGTLPATPGSGPGRMGARQRGTKPNDLSSFVFGKLPPQARELEEAVLGAMLIDKDAVSMAIDILKPESFYVDAHTLIYSSICRLFEQSKPVDILTVTQDLRLAGELEGSGWSLLCNRAFQSGCLSGQY